MRRWGLYVSRPMGPEESINLFSGEGAREGEEGSDCCGSGGCATKRGQHGEGRPTLPPSLPPFPPSAPQTAAAEPALFLVNPAGLVHALVYSNASFARPDLKQIVQGGWAWLEAGRGEALTGGCWSGGQQALPVR